MGLDHLEQEGHVRAPIARKLREELVDYVDAVDIGARRSDEGVPCFSMLVGVLNERAGEDFDPWYGRAVDFAADVVRGVCAGVERAAAAAAEIEAGMKEASESGLRTIVLGRYIKWKPAYFAAGGAEHPTDYVLFPGKGDWRVVTIPVAEGSRDDKRKLPSEWAGLEGDALSEVVGVQGARFCHRNAFIAAFDSKKAALEALSKWDRR